MWIFKVKPVTVAQKCERFWAAFFSWRQSRHASTSSARVLDGAAVRARELGNSPPPLESLISFALRSRTIRALARELCGAGGFPAPSAAGIVRQASPAFRGRWPLMRHSSRGRAEWPFVLAEPRIGAPAQAGEKSPSPEQSMKISARNRLPPGLSRTIIAFYAAPLDMLTTPIAERVEEVYRRCARPTDRSAANLVAAVSSRAKFFQE